MALTPKQERFCQCVASGMSYKDAYINAYDTNGKDTTVYTESGKLAIREDIQARIKTLQKPIETAAKIQGLNAREERINFIMERIKRCEEKEDETSLIRWNDQLCKLLSLYRDTDDNKENDNTLTNLDTSILAKIVKTG